MRRIEHQATVYLTSTERAAFEAYGRQFFLDAAGLLALLFGREMRVGQFRELILKDIIPDGTRTPKVTARLKNSEHAALKALALQYDESLSQIGAVLIRSELKDRWLERACATRFESHMPK